MSKDRAKNSKSRHPTSPTGSKHAHRSKSPNGKPAPAAPSVPPSPPPSTEKVRDVELGDMQRGGGYESDSAITLFLAGLLGFFVGLLLGVIIAVLFSIVVCCCFYDARDWWRDRRKRAFAIGFVLGILVALVVVLIVALALGARDRRVYNLEDLPPGTPIIIG